MKVSEELLEKLKPSVRLNVVRWFVTLEVSEVVVLRRVAGKGQEVVSSKNLKTKILKHFLQPAFTSTAQHRWFKDSHI